MIFYFSGTGNSFHAAKTIADTQNERLISIAEELDKNNESYVYNLKDNELLAFVYPVYAWAPPRIVLDFISKIKVNGKKPYVISLCTCGDEEGNATRVLQKALLKKGIHLDSAFSVRMPNNYIIGFDVDPEDLKQQKIQNAQKELEKINKIIKDRKSGVFGLVHGKYSFIKTSIINPLFNKFAIDTRNFYADDSCTGCGLCEKVCPIHTIKIDKKPVWGKECARCLACIHRCPVHAIQYGKATLNKGRYVYPEAK